MGLPSYLHKKNDIYYFRQACPKAIKSKFGKREIIKSLKVSNKTLAVRISRELKIHVDHLIEYLESYTLSKDEIDNFINKKNIEIVERYTNKRHPNNPLCENSSSLINVRASSFTHPPLQSTQTETSTTLPSVLEAPINQRKLHDMETLYKKFRTEKRRLGRWSEKTTLERDGYFSLIIDILKYVQQENNIYIESIRKEHIRKLKEILLILPKNYKKKFPNYSLSEIITLSHHVEKSKFDNISHKDIKKIQEKISLSTLKDKCASTIKGFWSWLNYESYIDSNIFDILRFEGKKQTCSWQTLNSEDLTSLFNDPIYKLKTHKYDYQFWVPILSAYTGCRLKEICQLQLSHIIIKNNIYYIKITQGHDTSLKTINSERKVPIHDDLINIGIIEYINHRKQNNDTHLFPELNNGNKTNSKRVSKWFNERFRKGHGVKDGKSFHSFRRTFINEMSKNGASDAEIRMLVGHKPEKNDTLNKHYKDDLSIKEKVLLINKYIKYETCNFPWKSPSYKEINFPWDKEKNCLNTSK